MLLVAICGFGGCKTRNGTGSEIQGGASGIRDNPRYAGWAHFKPGTESDYELTMQLSDGFIKSNLSYVLEAVGSDKVVLRASHPENSQVTIPAKLGGGGGSEAGGGAAFGLVPLPAVDSFVGHMGVEVGGKTYDCRYGTATSGEAKVTEWFSDDVPGGLCRAEVVEQQKTTKEIVLIRFSVPK